MHSRAFAASALHPQPCHGSADAEAATLHPRGPDSIVHNTALQQSQITSSYRSKPAARQSRICFTGHSFIVDNYTLLCRRRQRRRAEQIIKCCCR